MDFVFNIARIIFFSVGRSRVLQDDFIFLFLVSVIYIWHVELKSVRIKFIIFFLLFKYL